VAQAALQRFELSNALTGDGIDTPWLHVARRRRPRRALDNLSNNYVGDWCRQKCAT
jgi:hypothetical protein